jgi:putative spermidine/putrescine transport system permease protein
LAADAGVVETGLPIRQARLRVSGFFWQRPWLRVVGLLALPIAAFLVVYVGSLGVLFISSLWTANSLTSAVEHTWTLANYRTIFSTYDPYVHVAVFTLAMAAAVTLTCAVLAFPFAFFMARVAGKRTRALLFVMVLLPLWSSYLVRLYAWQTILAHNGAINWALNEVGLPDQNLAYTHTAMWIVYTYVWLPFMVLPVYAALERIPDSYLEASADLGGRGWRTFRSVILPLALPGVVAGSIFTFALTLGDYITPELIGGTNSNMIGTIVYENFSTNLPFAAAFAVIPLAIMGAYLLVARKLGAFEAL